MLKRILQFLECVNGKPVDGINDQSMNILKAEVVGIREYLRENDS